MSEGISKRKLLSNGAAALFVAVAVRWLPFPSANSWSTLRSALFAACGSREPLVVLGRACIKHAGIPTSAKKWNLAVSYKRAASAGVDFAHWFAGKCVSDFRAGRVVRVEGWVISETEFLLLSGVAELA
jgi:hypothetical protein